MIIKNGLVFQEDRTFSKKDLYIEDGRIVESADQVTDRTEVDAEGLYVLPGLVDVHSHGAVGCDFSDGDLEGLKKILAYERSCGVTSYCPTSMTIDTEELRRIFKAMGDFTEGPGMAHVAGINMEGPFLDVDKKGAHLAEFILAPDAGFFRECNEASGNKIR
ncbi:MAG: N-acetylglucosamine-6-phosphate deacetylase, partial [Lachnospiraceae bacterium]|nr:N-acetylglucosamine-6-phosphate deacetylase [Lachnospiraceae bacterium]